MTCPQFYVTSADIGDGLMSGGKTAACRWKINQGPKAHNFRLIQ